MQKQTLPYFLGSVEIRRIYNACNEDYVRHEDFEDFASDTYMQTPNIEAEEDKAVLLEAQVEVPYDDCKKVEYQWLLNGSEIQEDLNHTGVTMAVLCVSNADIGMDGSKYSCEIVADIYDYNEYEYIRATKVTAFDITLNVKCCLDQYTPSLTALYSAQPEVPEDTWPPVSTTKHISLALIKQDAAKYNGKYADFTIRGDMDDILQDKQKIKYAGVLQNVESNFVLFIEGRPGSGKTTFVHKFTRDWAAAPNGALRLVLLVSLRVLNYLNKPSLDLSDILTLFKDLKVSKDKAKVYVLYLMDLMSIHLLMERNPLYIK